MTTITVESYHTDLQHKAIADNVAAAAGIPLLDITGMASHNGARGTVWTITVLRRDPLGKPRLRRGKLTTKTVKWRP